MATNIIQYTGNGVSAVFPVTFAFNAPGDLVVSLLDPASGQQMTQALDTDYIVTGGQGGVGAIAMMSAPSQGQQITISYGAIETASSAGPMPGKVDDAKTTEAQKRAAAMLLVIELALAELYPGQVTSAGTLWDRKIALRLNDLEHMIIDYAAMEGIRTYVCRLTKDSEGGGFVTPSGDYKLDVNSDGEAIFEFIKDVVVETASFVVIEPSVLINKIAEIAANHPRVRQARAGLEQPIAPTYQPGQNPA